MYMSLVLAKAIGVASVIAFAVIWDLKNSKIPNKVTFCGIAFGVAVNIAAYAFAYAYAVESGAALKANGGAAAVLLQPQPQASGIGAALFGIFLSILIPFVSLIALYRYRVLGAGDVKLLMSVGAISGAWPVVEIMAYSFLAGGALSLIIVLSDRSAKTVINRLLSYIKTCYLQRRLLPYWAETDDAATNGMAVADKDNPGATCCCCNGATVCGAVSRAGGSRAYGGDGKAGPRFSIATRNGGMIKFSVAIAAGVLIFNVKSLMMYFL